MRASCDVPLVRCGSGAVTSWCAWGAHVLSNAQAEAEPPLACCPSCTACNSPSTARRTYMDWDATQDLCRHEKMGKEGDGPWTWLFAVPLYMGDESTLAQPPCPDKLEVTGSDPTRATTQSRDSTVCS